MKAQVEIARFRHPTRNKMGFKLKKLSDSKMNHRNFFEIMQWCQHK